MNIRITSIYIMTFHLKKMSTGRFALLAAFLCRLVCQQAAKCAK